MNHHRRSRHFTPSHAKIWDLNSGPEFASVARARARRPARARHADARGDDRGHLDGLARGSRASECEAVCAPRKPPSGGASLLLTGIGGRFAESVGSNARGCCLFHQSGFPSSARRARAMSVGCERRTHEFGHPLGLDFVRVETVEDPRAKEFGARGSRLWGSRTRIPLPCGARRT